MGGHTKRGDIVMRTLHLSIALCISILVFLPSNAFAEDYSNWSLPEGAKLRIGKGSVGSLRFSDDGNRLIVGGSIGYWIYDAHSGVELDLIPANPNNIIGMSPHGQMYVERTLDHTVNVRNLSDRSVITTLQGDNSDIYYVRFNLEKNILASDIGGEIRVWDLSTGELKTSIDLETDWIYDVVLSPDGTKLASISKDSDDRVFQLWDVATGSHITTLSTFAFNIRELVFTPDSNMIISGSENSIQFWDIAAGKRTLNFRTPYFHKLAVSPDGNKLVTRGQGGLHFWDIETGNYLANFGEHQLGCCSIAFSPDGKTLASGGGGSSELYLWDIASGDRKLTISGHIKGVASLAISPNGNILASSNWDNIHFWDPNTGEYKQMIYGRGRHSYHTNLVFSPDGNTLASIDYGAIHLWDISNKTQITTIYSWYGHGPGPENPPTSSDGYNSVAFSPDGQYIASGHGDNTIHFWYKGRTYIDVLKGHTDKVTSIAFFNDSHMLVSGSHDGTVRLWDFNSRTNLETFTGHTDKINSIALSPDDSIVASGSDNNTIIIRDITTGHQKVIQTDHTEGVHELTFSIDGKTLVSCGNWKDSIIQIWDVTNAELITNITTHTYGGGVVDFSPDGRTLISGSRDGTILFWDYNQLIGDDVETQEIAEDANRDGIINLQDLIFVASQFGEVGNSNTADVNGDGVINIADILLVAAALANENAAPSNYSKLDNVLDAAVVEQWLIQAQRLNRNIPKFQIGIAVLRQLLAAMTPEKTMLLANYPNPFNPETWIPYQLAEHADVTLRIYSSDGQLIRTIALGNQSSGMYQNRSRAAYWDSNNENGEPVASGVYFYTLTAGNFTATRRMVIRK